LFLAAISSFEGLLFKTDGGGTIFCEGTLS
jgi:hypothetical protein